MLLGYIWLLGTFVNSSCDIKINVNIVQNCYRNLAVRGLIHKIPSSADVCIMYDIACTLVQHLKGKRAAYLLERFQFALPAFHAYGHNAACQVCIEDSLQSM